MMEALAVVRLASNIVSFVDFGLRAVSEVRSIRNWIHGTTAETQELELIVDDV
jgi:hypothetical protein